MDQSELRDIKITSDGTTSGVTIELDGEVLPYVRSANIYMSTEEPIPCVDLSVSLNAILFEGKAKVQLNNLIEFDEDLGKELYERLKVLYEDDKQ